MAGGGPGWRVAGRQMKDRAKVQIGAVLLCKGERGEAARGHVGMVTWGHGDTREAQRLGGTDDMRVLSMEY